MKNRRQQRNVTYRGTDIHDLQPLTLTLLAPQRHRVRNHHPRQPTPIYPLNRVSAQYPVRDNRNRLGRAVRYHHVRGLAERAACVGHVVDDDGGAVCDAADEDHAGDFVGAGALLVDEGEGEVQGVGYGCCAGEGGAGVISLLWVLHGLRSDSEKKRGGNACMGPQAFARDLRKQ